MSGPELIEQLTAGASEPEGDAALRLHGRDDQGAGAPLPGSAFLQKPFSDVAPCSETIRGLLDEMSSMPTEARETPR